MFGKLGVGEIALLVGAALLIFGPAKLPSLGRSVGEGIREFKKSMQSIADDAQAPAPTAEKKA